MIVSDGPLKIKLVRQKFRGAEEDRGGTARLSSGLRWCVAENRRRHTPRAVALLEEGTIRGVCLLLRLDQFLLHGSGTKAQLRNALQAELQHADQNVVSGVGAHGDAEAAEHEDASEE